MNCQHGPAKKLEVKKPGPNQGRMFYACAQPMGQQCDFFCFEGETPRGVHERSTPNRDELIGKVLANMNTKLDTLTELVKELLSTRPT